MTGLQFYKMSGSGNDFIIADNRDGKIAKDDLPGLAKALCARKISVGADGLILVENSSQCDFKWQFYNADGSEAEMCGNGARCVARYAYLNKMAGEDMTFETLAGVIHAQVMGENVKVGLTDPTDVKYFYPLEVDGVKCNITSMNTGVPHVVLLVGDIEQPDVEEMGRKIRFHKAFAPAGTNVNFVEFRRGELAVRTYERGVEGETLACGTGAVASALARVAADAALSPVKVLTRSGQYLLVHYRRTKDGFGQIYLEGDAQIIYQGELGPDALKMAQK
ncbi:MAG: diaminopimelate epimerase [Desulfatibacillum sp.]|nr:diaminopimelate epimerase [Desulfatibacillum sp.]